MKTNWKAIGIATLSAAVLFYPAMKLYQYITTRRSGDKSDQNNDDHHIKAFIPAYRGKGHTPHHRQSHNGHSGLGQP